MPVTLQAALPLIAKASLAALALSGLLAAPLSTAAPLDPHHPILGTWEIDAPDGSCSEVYIFRADGTTLVTSAEEVAESEFQISAEPSEAGFYKLVDTLTKDNGKKDCGGRITTLPSEATHFIRFSTAGDIFVMCDDERLERCLGPFHRPEGEES